MTLRWEGDKRGRGIADAAGLAREVDAFADRMRDEGWVTEDPEAHLAHHLVRACAPGRRISSARDPRPGRRLARLGAPDGRGTFQDVRGAVMGLVGHVLEGSAFVRERRSDEALEFDVATGMMPGEGGFSGHGHVLRIRVQQER